MRVTTLVENQPSPDDPLLRAEWGLSQCVEIGSRRLLLDMGASDAFARNADRLGIDLATVDAAILSHHHYDHGGGLRRFLGLNDRAPVYLGQMPAGAPVGHSDGHNDRYIGLDPGLMTEHAARFRVVRERSEVLPGVFVLPGIDGRHARPSGNRRLFVRTAQELAADDFRHEIAVAICERGMVTAFTGCAHSGVLNMIEKVQQEFPGVPIRSVVGGFHLVAHGPQGVLADREEAIVALGRRLLDLGVEETWTGHCTSTQAYGVLRRVMCDRLRRLHTGSRFEL